MTRVIDLKPVDNICVDCGRSGGATWALPKGWQWVDHQRYGGRGEPCCPECVALRAAQEASS